MPLRRGAELHICVSPFTEWPDRAPFGSARGVGEGGVGGAPGRRDRGTRSNDVSVDVAFGTMSSLHAVRTSQCTASTRVNDTSRRYVPPAGARSLVTETLQSELVVLVSDVGFVAERRKV